LRRPFRSSSAEPVDASARAPAREADAKRTERPKDVGWEFDAGSRIAPERSVLKRLGGGTRYDVYLVWDERLYALVVAKVLRPDQVEDEGALRELRREAELLERLAHPVLLRGFGAVLGGPHPHVVVEHLEGPTLSRLIRRQRTLPLEQALPLALHVAAALHYLSTEDVVHLDVKPSNIVMGVPPRVIDLSIARSLERAARVTVPIGTDPYMAPEQCDPKAWPGRIGFATDVWGLGATLHHAVGGDRPFRRPDDAGAGDDPAVRFPQLIAEPSPLPSDVPRPLEELVFRMLAKDPAERPTAAAVAEALEPLVPSPPRRPRPGRGG
jgi:eukaryotic-like serine/threonine-protein kinase